MAMKAPLGRLERVQVRDYWGHEALEFTPWLALPENIALLGETIGLDLEVESVEESVGPFRADILCRDTATNHYVLVENQLERTDHGHLGQLMTYAAGLDAATVVWVAPRFADEHRAALDWLNKITAADFNFFGLEVELWRIGDSALAPKLNIVSQPNDWSSALREVATGGGATSGAITETGALYLEFWTQFREFMLSRGSPVKVRKPSKEYWTDFGLGRSGFHVNASVSVRKAQASVFLIIDSPEAKPFYFALEAGHKAALEALLGPLSWQEFPQGKASYVGTYHSCDVTDRAAWPEINAWLGDTLERFHDTVGPIVRGLVAAGAATADPAALSPDGMPDHAE